MKTLCFFLLTILLCAQTVRAADAMPRDAKNLSLRNEVQHAIDQGLAWLQPKQAPAGFWTTPEHPAITALALTAFLRDPGASHRDAEFVKRGFDFLLSCAHPDGGIYKKDELLNYNTSVSVMALLAADDPKFEPALKAARKFLIGQQNDLGEKGKQDTPFDGGIGYGDDEPHADLSNTVMALEALYYTKHLVESGELTSGKDLNWQAAIDFIQRCQNLPDTNPEKWASGDPQNKGGFVYYPGESMAGKMTLPDGKTALRSYGSMSYAGLLSYIYADLKRDDPRAKAAFEWLRKNYSLDENPGMGAQGLYYYFHMMAKALSTYGVKELELADGKKVDWRADLAKRLINLQKSEGFWINENGRFWEKDPVLTTCYAVLALEMIHRAL